jgi:hypothetical protein
VFQVSDKPLRSREGDERLRKFRKISQQHKNAQSRPDCLSRGQAQRDGTFESESECESERMRRLRSATVRWRMDLTAGSGRGKGGTKTRSDIRNASRIIRSDSNSDFPSCCAWYCRADDFLTHMMQAASAPVRFHFEHFLTRPRLIFPCQTQSTPLSFPGIDSLR